MLVLERRYMRLGAWACVVILAYLSLIPGDLQTRTGAPSQFEHFVAYGGTAILFTLGYPRKLLLVGLGLAIYGSILEVLQLLSPGRFASLVDAAASITGVGVGIAVSLFLSRHYLGRRGA